MANRFFRIAAVLAALWPAAAAAQSGCPAIVTNAVLTAAQWNNCFALKQNIIPYTTVNKAGDVMTGKLVTVASAVSQSGFGLPHGSAAVSPINGDMWTTTAGLYVRINGATVGPLVSTATGGVVVGTTTVASGTTTRVLMDNAGVLGEYSISGTGNVAMTTSPTFVTPTLGAALATSINGLTLTSSTGTLTIANGKTHTVSNSIAFTGTDSTSFAFPGTSDTVATLTASQTLTNKTISGGVLSGTLSGTPTLSGANFITLGNIATQNAYTLLGNFTGSSAGPTATAIGSLTSKPSPAAADLVLIADSAASNQLKQTTVSARASAGSVGSLGGLTGTVGLSYGITTSSNNILVSLSYLTNSIGSDVALNNTGLFFDGPTVAQGTSGTWCATGTVTMRDSAGGAVFIVKLYDGTTTIASTITRSGGTLQQISASVSGCIVSPAGNIRIAVQDSTATTGVMLFNNSGLSKDSTVNVFRVQ